MDALGTKVIGHETDASGKIILTKLNKDKLKKITQHLGGKSIETRLDDRDVVEIKSFIESFEKESYTDAIVSLKNELYPFLAAFSAAALAIEGVL